MILNPNKTKALVVSRSRTVNPPNGDLVLFGVSICQPWHSWSEVWLQAHLRRPCECYFFAVSLKEFLFWGWWSLFLWTPLYCFAASMHLFSQSLSIVLRCGGLLLNVIFSFSSARCIRWPGFALIRHFCRCAIDVMLLHCECCKRLIRTRIIVCSVSFHLLLSEFDILERRLQPSIRGWCIQVQNIPICKVFSAGSDSCVECLPYTVFNTWTLIVGSREGAVNRWLLPWACFSVFPWHRCLLGCVRNLWTFLFFTLLPVLLVLLI